MTEITGYICNRCNKIATTRYKAFRIKKWKGVSSFDLCEECANKIYFDLIKWRRNNGYD